MADSDQAIRDIIAQINGSPTDAQVAANLPPPSWAAAPAAPSTVPGPGGYSPADRFNKFALPEGGGPLSVDDANKVIASYESTGGHAFAPGPNGYSSGPAYAAGPAPGPPLSLLPQVAAAAPKADDWAPPTPTMVAPPIGVPTMGALVAPRPLPPTMGVVLGRR